MLIRMIKRIFYRAVDFLPGFGTQRHQDQESYLEADSTSICHFILADCLGNAVVLREIFQHFSNSDLLKLSRGNKLWNYEARSVMKSRGNLIARLLFLDGQTCQKYLDAFAADLRRMNVVPFSGISIDLGHDRGTCRTAALDSTCDTILDQLSVKIYMTGVLRALVARTPNLQELHTQGPINLMLNVLEGRSALLVLQSYVAFNEVPENAINKIRLEKLQLHYEGRSFNAERFNRITPRLLEANSATLNSIDVDAILAVPLMCYRIRFENVRELTMDINPGRMELDEPRILRILKDFDFTRIVPNLETVMIFGHFDFRELLPNQINGFVEQANTRLKEPKPDRAINIKELDLSTSISSACEFFAEIIPHIERLSLREEDGTVSFGSIWKHWVNVKELNVMAEVDQRFEDLDSVICGIFPEEAVELRQKDEEFLKKVNMLRSCRPLLA